MVTSGDWLSGGAVMATTPDINDVAEMLVENGATYVAVNEQSLVDEPAQFYYHLAVGTSDDQKETIGTYLDEEVGHRPYDRQIGAIRIADQLVPACIHSVLHGELHLYRREPIYVADGMVGLDHVTIEDGVAGVQEIVDTQPTIEPRPAETAALEDVVAELAEAGAGSVEVAHDPLVIGEQTVDLRVPMVPAAGKPIVGPIDAVEVDGETYPFHATLTLDGPYGCAPGWTALYVGDNVQGLEPVPVTEGCEAGHELIARASEVDSVHDLTPPQNR